MKNNNLLLTIVTVILATSGVIASVRVDQATYVKGISSENTSTHCIFVGNLCNNTGSNACTVSVPLTPSGSIVTNKTYSDSGCTVLIKDNRAGTKSGVPEEHVISVEF